MAEDVWVMTEQIQRDVGDFWEKYTKEHHIDKHIILMVIDTKYSINRVLKNVVNELVDEIIRQREFEGKSAIEPVGGKG